MRILGLIPARGGSKGVPNKNIKLLDGKELIKYTIEAALSCNALTEVVVSTDDNRIAEISKNAGAKVPFLRPSELAQDNSPTIDTIIHALCFYKDLKIEFDAICLLQPTTPFRQAKDIDTAIETFNKANSDSLVSVREVPHTFNPHWVFMAKKEDSFLKLAMNDEKIIPRRQELPKAFYRDGAIYLTKSSVVLKQRSLYGEKIAYFMNDKTPNINIDTLKDWEEAEQEIKKIKECQ